jgi:transcriptional regulator with XRE-family HTH domain
MSRTKKGYDAFTEKYYGAVARRISNAVKEIKISQEKIAERCKEKLNFEITQSTISKILNYSSSDESRLNSISLVQVIAICDALELDIAQILKVTPDDVDIASVLADSKFGTKNSRISSFIFDPSDDAFSGYLGKYYCYFYPTISTEEKLLTATLEFSSNTIYDEERVCDAKLVLDTKNFDDNRQLIKKEYSGRLIISKPQTSCYCILSNPKIGEICMLSFYHRYYFSQKLLCRLANVLTTSIGDDRRPTVHRMLISRRELSEEFKDFIKAELLLNSAEIIIKEDCLKEIKDKLPPEVLKLFESGDIQKTQFYCIPEAKIDASNIPMEARLRAIINLRGKSIADKNNRIVHRADETVYYYLSSMLKDEDGQ